MHTRHDHSAGGAGAKAPARFLLATLLFVAGAGAAATQAHAAPPQIGKPAADFSLLDTTEQNVRLSALRGRPVLLTFWATWCEPCKIEMPEIQKAYERFKTDGFVVLAVNFGEKAEKARAYAETNGLTFPVLVDRRANVASQYSVVSLPVSLFIDADGVVQERVFGGTLTLERIAQVLHRLRQTSDQ
ncbi:MAG TPA: TlpA disulfide reductase family protein [Nitrospiria bacterium]|nr:TlpA disulfide reductase family protein [Nitrospiria bacterium]